MLALALAAVLSSADLQQWIDDRPEVRAYEQQRMSERLPKTDDFRRAPILPRQVACRGSHQAMLAAVTLFKTADASKLTLTEPSLLAKNNDQPVVMLNEQAKTAIEDRARSYQQDASLYEPACLG